MKIWIHTMYFLPEFGSAPILMNELAAFLSGAGHDVEIITTIPRPPHNRGYEDKLFVRETRGGFLVKRFLTNSTAHPLGRLVAWSIFTAASIFNLLAVRRGDLLFLRLPPLQLGVTGALARRLRGANVLLNVQDVHPDLSIEAGLLRNPLVIRIARAFERWTYRQAEDIVVISEGFKKNLEAKGVPSRKIKVIPNWVDTDFLRPLPKQNSLSEKFCLDRRFTVMFSGTISISSYGTLARVLEAAEILRHENDIVFVMVGEGLKGNDLRSKAEALRLTNVLFLPFQPFQDLPHLLASSDVLLVPLDKKKSELSVPSKLYHVMAAGRPLLGLAEPESEVFKMILGTGCGVCVPPDDPRAMAQAILRLKGSPDLRAEMAARGRRFAQENFSRDHVLKKYEQLISSMSR